MFRYSYSFFREEFLQNKKILSKKSHAGQNPPHGPTLPQRGATSVKETVYIRFLEFQSTLPKQGATGIK